MKGELKRHIIFTSILGLVLALSVFVLWKSKSFIISKVNKTVELVSQTASIEANKSAFMKENKNFLDLKEKVSSLNKYFFDSSSVPLFLSEIEEEANKYGIAFSLKDVSIDSGKETNKKSLVASFSGSGDYSKILGFIESISKKPYRVVFDSVFLNAQTKQAEEGSKEVPKKEWDFYGKIRLMTFR